MKKILRVILIIIRFKQCIFDYIVYELVCIVRKYSGSTLCKVFANPSSPSQFINIYILPTLYTQIKLFGNENKAKDHTQQFLYLKDEKQNSPSLFTRKQKRNLGEFSNASYAPSGIALV